MFAAMPLVLLPALWLGFGLALFGAANAFNWFFTFNVPLPLWGRVLVVSILFGVVESPIALSAAIVCRLAKRARVAGYMPALACLLLGLVSIQICPVLRTHNVDGTWTFYWITPYLPSGSGEYLFVNGPGLLTGMARVTQVFQFVLPLVIGGCVFCLPQRPTLIGFRRAVAG